MRTRAIWTALCLAFFTTGGQVQAQTPAAYGIKTRPTVAPYFDEKVKVPQIGQSADMMAVNAFPNLTFQNPMGIAQIPGTDQMIVWEREGTVRSFLKDPNVGTTTLLLDITSRCQGWDDCGLLALVFHPGFSLASSTNRYVYIWYTYNPPGLIKGSALARPVGTPNVACWNRLSRFDVDGNGIIQPDSELVMIHQKTKTVWHKGSGMFFHPTDGFLYISVGEDFNAYTNTQLVDRSLLGGILRIDVDQIGGSVSHPIPRQPYNPTPVPILTQNESYTANYYIPNDNPLVGTPSVLEEFYAIGLRSPDEMTFDPVSGRIFISDVGDWGVRGREEINIIEPGEVAAHGLLNFEWDQMVGTKIVSYTDRDHKNSKRFYANSYRKTPRLEYDHSENGNVAAIMGGYVYRGTEQSTLLGGKYVFADNMSGKIWTLDESGPAPTKILIAMLPNGPGANRGQNYLGISSFGLDSSGEMYLCRLSNEGGGIFKLVPKPTSTTVTYGLPDLLSKTGLFTSLTSRTPSTKLIPYTVNHPFWSDGALKYRWAAIPTGTTVGYSPTGEWTFPEGSVFVKHFDLPVSDITPTTVRRLETRVIVKTGTGVYGGTYKWNTTRTNATLVKDTTFEDIKVAIRSAGTAAGSNIGLVTVPAGTSSQVGTKLTISGSGTGIGGTADQCRFNYIKRKGDFDFFVRVEKLYPSIGGTTPSARVGLVVRQDFTPGSPSVGVSVGMTAGAGINEVSDFLFHQRAAADALMTSTPSTSDISAAYPQVWLRLKRTGDSFIAYAARNAVDWVETGRTTLALSPTADLLWGVTCSAQEAGKRAAAVVYFQTSRIQRWTFPGPAACTACHTQNSGWVLGLNTRQLNCNYLYSATKVTDNQLRSWGHVGLLDTPPADVDLPTLDKLFAVGDTAASVQDRARSYLDSNCGYCHRPGGVNALWDGRWNTPLASQGLLNVDPAKDLGIAGAKIIAPGDLDRSVLFVRTSALAGHQMPPLGKNKIDTAGVELLKQWILSLPP